MHHIYTTEAFVVHSTPQGEANKFLLLFTRQFGMIGAVAQGIRLSQSKLRFHVQDSSYSTVSVVRGKEVWRLTGAVEIEHSKSKVIHLKILKLLKRLLHGEEKNDSLFDIVHELYQSSIEEKDYETVECLTVLRILNSLGYIKNIEEFGYFLSSNTLDTDTLTKFLDIKPKAILAINQALKESQL